MATVDTQDILGILESCLYNRVETIATSYHYVIESAEIHRKTSRINDDHI